LRGHPKRRPNGFCECVQVEQNKYSDDSKLPDDEVVSKRALALMEAEARRVGKLLSVDSVGLKHAEDMLKALPNEHTHNPLQALHQGIMSVERKVAQLQTGMH
jgi:hypothetical protein